MGKTNVPHAIFGMRVWVIEVPLRLDLVFINIWKNWLQNILTATLFFTRTIAAANKRTSKCLSDSKCLSAMT